jgi:O-antigen/teichoic acid export membrane protein
MAGMEDRAIRGVPWTMLSYALNKILTLATTIALARLLSPEDFGLMAYATLALLFLTIYRDVGVGSALIVRRRLDEADKATTLTIILAVSITAAVLIAALSPLIASLLDEPRLAGILAALSLTLVFGAPAWFYEALFQRELEFRKRFLAMTAQNVLFTPVALTLAIAGAGVWSLVIGYVAGSAASAVAYVLLAPERIRPAFDWGRAKTALSSGLGFMVQGGVALVRQNVDYLAVGRFLGTIPLGFYSLAYRLSEVPYLGIADPVAKVTFPGFARMRARGEDVSDAFLTVLRLVALVTCPIGVILSGVADPFVAAVLGDKWLPMIGPLSVLGIWAAVRSTTATTGWLLNSVGLARVLGSISIGILIPLVPGVIVAAELGGTTDVAWVVLADTVIELVAISVYIHTRGGISVARQWRAVRPAVLGAAPTWVVARLLAEATSGLAPILGLAVSLAGAVGLYLAILTVFEPGLIRQVLRQIGQTLRRAPAIAPETPEPGPGLG